MSTTLCSVLERKPWETYGGHMTKKLRDFKLKQLVYVGIETRTHQTYLTEKTPSQFYQSLFDCDPMRGNGGFTHQQTGLTPPKMQRADLISLG